MLAYLLGLFVPWRILAVLGNRLNIHSYGHIISRRKSLLHFFFLLYYHQVDEAFSYFISIEAILFMDVGLNKII